MLILLTCLIRIPLRVPRLLPSHVMPEPRQNRVSALLRKQHVAAIAGSDMWAGGRLQVFLRALGPRMALTSWPQQLYHTSNNNKYSNSNNNSNNNNHHHPRPAWPQLLTGLRSDQEEESVSRKCSRRNRQTAEWTLTQETTRLSRPQWVGSAQLSAIRCALPAPRRGFCSSGRLSCSSDSWNCSSSRSRNSSAYWRHIDSSRNSSGSWRHRDSCNKNKSSNIRSNKSNGKSIV
mmetsp:Transcript_47660/g.77306  ORF Transcript_47660/g.77306 Transcript_47660/m.77306 type:complete len:233 (-) Transcript_47660:578-1276(-)